MITSFNMRSFLLSVKRNLFLIIINITIFTLFGYFYGFFVYKQKYEAVSEITIKLEKLDDDENYDPTQSLRLVQSISEFTKTNKVITRAIEKNDLDIDVDTVERNLNVSFSSNSIFVKIRYVDTDSKRAKDVVSSISKEAVEIAKTEYPIIGNIINNYTVSSEVEEVGLNRIVFVVLGTFAGFFIIMGCLVLVEVLKTSISDRYELENIITKYPVLGVVNYVKRKRT